MTASEIMIWPSPINNEPNTNNLIFWHILVQGCGSEYDCPAAVRRDSIDGKDSARREGTQRLENNRFDTFFTAVIHIICTHCIQNQIECCFKNKKKFFRAFQASHRAASQGEEKEREEI